MLSNALIKVGFCVAYDWELLRKSLPRVYEFADLILLSLDQNRQSWSGIPYDFDESAFQRFLLEADPQKKIRVYEDDFSQAALSPLENDNRQRNLMAKEMGEGGWHIQIDSDEYFLDFEGFTRYLKKLNPHPHPRQKPLNVCCNLIPLIKKLREAYLFVDYAGTPPEVCPFATNRPEYFAARRNGHFNHLSPFFVLHETWARGEEELWRKINSWGHDLDFEDKNSFFNLWKVLDHYNYRFIKNFHPIQGEVWPALGFCKGVTIEELIGSLNQRQAFYLFPSYLFWKNSRNWARFKTLISKFSGKE